MIVEYIRYDLVAHQPEELVSAYSTAAHLQGFRKGPNFPPFLSAIKPFIGEIAEMRHYVATPLVWKR